MAAGAQLNFEKFQTVKQEPLRLKIALEDFFSDPDPLHREVYGQYLQKRIRPAVSALIESEDLDKMNVLAD